MGRSLSGYVLTLQRFEELHKEGVADGSVIMTENENLKTEGEKLTLEKNQLALENRNLQLEMDKKALEAEL